MERVLSPSKVYLDALGGISSTAEQFGIKPTTSSPGNGSWIGTPRVSGGAAAGAGAAIVPWRGK